MKECCQQTFKDAFNEVLLAIRHRPEQSLLELERALQYAIKMLEEDKNELD